MEAWPLLRRASPGHCARESGGPRVSRTLQFDAAKVTVAQLSGTSVAMIEQHYGHLVRDDAEQALSRLVI